MRSCSRPQQSSLYAPREFESPRGVGEGPPQGAAPDPPDAGSSQTHIRVHPLRVHSILPLSPLPPTPLAGRRRRRLCCRLHRHRLRRRRRHRRCYRRRSRRRSCRSPPLTSPNTTHHPPTVGGPRQRHKGGKPAQQPAGSCASRLALHPSCPPRHDPPAPSAPPPTSHALALPCGPPRRPLLMKPPRLCASLSPASPSPAASRPVCLPPRALPILLAPP